MTYYMKPVHASEGKMRANIGIKESWKLEIGDWKLE
jgi:hypothetical protein